MSDTTTEIQPALSPDEWALHRSDRGLEVQAFPEEASMNIQDWGAMSQVSVGSEDLPAIIALANAALPDSDGRKITRETVRALRDWIVPCNNHAGFRQLAVLLHHHASALAALLPPK